MTEQTYGLEVVDQIIKDSVHGREHQNERWESFSQQFVEAIKTAKVYVDCGAEYGFYVKLATKFGPPDIRIFGFEPEPARFDLLKKVFAVYPNVSIYPQALSNRVTSSYLVKPGVGISPSFDGMMHSNGERIGVKTSFLDLLLPSDLCVDVLKMDIEGAEDLALMGALNTMDQSRNLTMFIEFHPNQSEARIDTYRNLLALGFYIDDEDADRMIHGGRVVLRRS